MTSAQPLAIFEGTTSASNVLSSTSPRPQQLESQELPISTQVPGLRPVTAISRLCASSARSELASILAPVLFPVDLSCALGSGKKVAFAFDSASPSPTPQSSS